MDQRVAYMLMRQSSSKRTVAASVKLLPVAHGTVTGSVPKPGQNAIISDRPSSVRNPEAVPGPGSGTPARSGSSQRADRRRPRQVALSRRRTSISFAALKKLKAESGQGAKVLAGRKPLAL